MRGERGESRKEKEKYGRREKWCKGGKGKIGKKRPKQRAGKGDRRRVRKEEAEMRKRGKGEKGKKTKMRGQNGTRRGGK